MTTVATSRRRRRNEKTVWLSFDLGLRADYDGLYAWLDSHDAKECAGTLALFKYKFRKDFLKELEAELRKTVQLRPTDRIYIAFRGEDGRMKGRFIIGKRRRAAWLGLAPGTETVDDEG